MLLSEQWIDSATKQIRQGVLDESNDSSIVMLLDLCNDQPLKAVQVIYEIMEKTSDSDLLSYLGAGPLEDLLVKHPEFLNKFSNDSIDNPKLQQCLSQVNLDDV
ncbi:MAG: hypothetical protein EKK65_02705 [Lysobacterales bacterium]|nr:MAG: hypothetical protein EKK65_02705 [Xanthomonadales bacterium]